MQRITCASLSVLSLQSVPFELFGAEREKNGLSGGQ